MLVLVVIAVLCTLFIITQPRYEKLRSGMNIVWYSNLRGERKNIRW